MKKLLGVFLSLSMLLSSSSVVLADSREAEDGFVSLDEIEKYDDKACRDNALNEIVITDPMAIKKLATEQGFPDVEDIKKLTYTIGEVDQNELQDEMISPLSGVFWTHIGNVENKGTGYKLVDHFDENRYQGPISGTYTYTRTDRSAYNATVSVDADIVSAGVGFTIGEEHTKSDSVTINVPAGKRIILKVWTNYQKKTFTVYREYSTSVGLWYPEGTGSAYKPVGLIFTQAEY